MSHTDEKTTYFEEGAYGSTTKHTLYMHMNNTCDITTFYDDNGNLIFSFSDTLDRNIFEAMIGLAWPKLSPKEFKIENMSNEDREFCGI